MAAPTDITLSVSPVTVNENAANATIIATITGVDADTSAGSLTYSLVNNAGGRFSITAGNKLTVNNSLLLDYELQSRYEVIIRVSDGSGSYDEVFSVDLVDVIGESVTGGAGADTIIADDTGGHDYFSGGLANDTLKSGLGNDTLDGGDGADSMEAGEGNDSYIVDNTGDIVKDEFFNGGTDIVVSSVDYSLQYTTTTVVNGQTIVQITSRHVENLTLTGAAVNATGNILRNMLTGNGNNNVIDGYTSADTMIGMDGDDTYYVDDKLDVVVEAASAGTDKVIASVDYSLTSANTTYPLREVEILELKADAGSIDGTGNALANTLIGNEGANILDGKAGNDTMRGGAGSDTYVVAESGDTVQETDATATGGTADEVKAGVDYTLVANVENLTLTGTAISGTGNGLKNKVTGNGGNNLLDGGGEVDTLTGGAGDDTYVLDSASERVVEVSTGGIDTIRIGATINLASINFSYVENVELQGTTAFNAFGNLLANQLTGNDAANKLDGDLGADGMQGLDGNDTYVVDNLGDVVTELATDDGTDLVESSVTFLLGDNLENLTLTGTSNINGTGNGSANTITGNGGKNILNGGSSGDTLKGAGGDDTYVIDSSDTINEVSGQGTDTIQASFNYTLSSNTGTGGTGFVENLTLTGSATSGTGNNLNNKLVGNASNNVLNGLDGADWLEGGSGSDTMIGGAGNDTYVINGSDTLQETMVGTSGGIDTVRASVGTTLGNNLENLVLTGAAVTGNGNAAGNAITGTGGDNVLDGKAGNDTLFGGLGNDELWGGAGRDVFVFDKALNASTNVDWIKDYAMADDSIRLSKAIFAAVGTALEAAELNIGSAAADSTDRIIYNQTNGELFYDADGIGTIGAIKFGKISAGLALTVSEFILAA